MIIHFLHPYLKAEQRSLQCVTNVAKQMPAVIKKDDIDKLCEEWKIYMNEETDDDSVNIENLSGCTKRIDVYWSSILQKKNSLGNIKYLYLSKLVKAVLSIYHGQADVERGFSTNRHYVTTSRASLNEKTINSLRTVEAEIRSRGGDLSKIPVTPKMLKYFREAHKMYKKYLEQNEKEKDAVNKRKHDDELQTLENRKKDLQKAVDTSQSLIAEANTRLAKAVPSKNMTEICSAQVLLESGHKMFVEKGEELKKVELQLNALVKKIKK